LGIEPYEKGFAGSWKDDRRAEPFFLIRCVKERKKGNSIFVEEKFKYVAKATDVP
jgi:hypothetical protein